MLMSDLEIKKNLIFKILQKYKNLNFYLIKKIEKLKNELKGFGDFPNKQNFSKTNF